MVTTQLTPQSRKSPIPSAIQQSVAGLLEADAGEAGFLKHHGIALAGMR
jgi:hypothetical protein